jgi:hypothetical protein
MITVSAAVKFNPSPPARVDNRNMKISGSELKSAICNIHKHVVGTLDDTLQEKNRDDTNTHAQQNHQ